MKNWSERITRVVVAVSVAVLAGSVGIGMTYGAPVPKVTICHLPPGNPSNVQLITVGAPAVPKHVQQHGDAVCDAGNTDCCIDDDGVVCTNVQTDVDNCGACGAPCEPVANGTAGCSNGACTQSCNEGFTECTGECVDLGSDPNHCGACDNACAAGQTCTDGQCVSPDNTLAVVCDCNTLPGGPPVECQLPITVCATSCPSLPDNVLGNRCGIECANHAGFPCPPPGGIATAISCQSTFTSACP